MKSLEIQPELNRLSITDTIKFLNLWNCKSSSYQTLVMQSLQSIGQNLFQDRREACSNRELLFEWPNEREQNSSSSVFLLPKVEVKIIFIKFKIAQVNTSAHQP